tara:strand:+ start:8412 stop:8534 length:123 start_codon:yes stop_codon:yes gene_type:complete
MVMSVSPGASRDGEMETLEGTVEAEREVTDVAREDEPDSA